LFSQRPVGLLGPTVDPLGELLIMLLPDGLRALLAPAVPLPAPAPVLPLPLMPVVAPLDVDPVPEAPPVEPPLCANAALLANASAAANPIAANLIDLSPRFNDEEETAGPPDMFLLETLERHALMPDRVNRESPPSPNSLRWT
jgi:hypothetical protein